MGITYHYVFQDKHKILERSDYEEKLDIIKDSFVKVGDSKYIVTSVNTLFDFELKKMYYMIEMEFNTENENEVIKEIEGEGFEVKKETKTHNEVFAEKFKDSPIFDILKDE